MPDSFDLQGHRGARGLRPENTLPSFEVALDLLVSGLETDIHLTKDGVPVLCHDETLTPAQARVLPGASSPPPMFYPKISSLTLAEIRGYLVDLNPDPNTFGKQSSAPTQVAQAFAMERALPLYAIPTLEDLFAFVAAYSGRMGRQTRKTDVQRRQATQVRFNLELKRVPFRPGHIGDLYDGDAPGELEKRVIQVAREAAVLDRVVLQSFDHRVLRSVRQVEPAIRTAILVARTAPIAPARLVLDAGAQIYSPDFTFLDERQINQLQDAGVPVVPFTVNEPGDMSRLLTWGVDGMITDYPDRLIPLLKSRQLRFA